ncbi:MAG TPA: hypothetical protein VG297_03790 [Bryobacteraceae bacterium]|jgi:hypothetical protein|nr:hypothetical protein [Bryobacteraceae bacterium]
MEAAPHAVLESIRGCARRGDWQNAQALVETLPQQTLPRTIEGLAAHLRDLQDTLIVARTARAHLAESLIRLQAVAGFNRTRAVQSAPRQEFGEMAEY